jgi:hypothetical protein
LPVSDPAARSVVTRRADPHVALAATVALVLLCEVLRGSATLLTSPVWPTLQAVIAALGLLVAWHEQNRLTLTRVVLLGLVLQLGMIIIHLALGVQSDGDSSTVYHREGQALLAGTYPSAEYPAGAVLVFTLDSLFGGGGHGTRVANAFVMVPWQLVTVVAVWGLRTRWSPWLATVLAIWPLNAFFWEFKFDLAPTAALAVGLLLASRRRWGYAGVALGVGAALKWTPALAGITLVIWLLSRGRRREATSHLVALAGTFLLVNLPFLLTSPHALLASYRLQSGRGISAESMFYIPPVIGLEHSISVISHDVNAPGWANVLAAVLQVLFVALVLVLATRVKELRAVVALAAMAPVVFLLANRVFSPQYLVTIVAAWCLAGALLVESRREQLMLGFLIFAATLANVLVYPTGTALWPTFTAILFLLGFLTTGWLVRRSVGADEASSR